jgi:AcrR family transcriptional regulator
VTAEKTAKRTTKRRAETRSRLLAAAREVFAQQGFGRTSVEDVCERAGYTRGAFYSNFVSLDELFLAMWEQRSSELASLLQQALAEAARARVESLEELVDRLMDLIPVEDAWYRIEAEFTAHALRNPPLRQVMADRERQIMETLLSFLRSTGDQLGLRATRGEELAAALVAVHDGTTVQCLIEPDNPHVRRRRRDLFLNVLNSYTEAKR